MKRLLNLLIGVFCIIGLVSCGTPKEREVTVSNVEISGFIKDYLEVVDGTYKFTHNGDEAFITIKLKLKTKPAIIPETESFPSIDLNPIGEGGEIFNTGNGLYSKFQVYSDELNKVTDLLNSNVGDTKSVSFKWHYFHPKDDIAKQIFKHATSFELVDEAFNPNKTASAPKSSNGGKSSNWTSVLNEYERYVDKYISCMRKVSNGDMEAYSDLASLMESAENLGNELEDASDEMSASEIARYSRITAKFAEAMSDM